MRMNEIQHQINKKVQENREEEINRQANEIDKISDSSSKMFKAVGALYTEQFQNPKVEDDDGKLSTSANAILKLTSEFFKKKF